MPRTPRAAWAPKTFIFFTVATEKEMPAFPFEYDHSKVEGVQFHWLAQPVEIIEDKGRAAAVKFVETQLGAPDSSGRRRAEPVAGSEYAVECDLVIPALGQSRLMGQLTESRGIAVHRGSIVVDRPPGAPATRNITPAAIV